MAEITHSTQTAQPNDPTKDVSADAWNEPHTGTAMTLISLQMSAAQFKALDVTPFTLVPALGGRNYVVPFECIVHFRAGATPFDADLLTQLGWGTTPAEIKANKALGLEVFCNGATADRYGYSYDEDYEWSAAAIENVPFGIVIRNFATAPTVGDGTLTIRFYYDVIDGAP